jgi:hypothetical protein
MDEKINMMTPMFEGIPGDGADTTMATAQGTPHLPGAGQQGGSAESWDPYEVWLTRVRKPREQRALATIRSQQPTRRERDYTRAELKPQLL